MGNSESCGVRVGVVEIDDMFKNIDKGLEFILCFIVCLWRDEW